eukprot:1155061-Pelagomonas_calceolata.AAC.4
MKAAFLEPKGLAVTNAGTLPADTFFACHFSGALPAELLKYSCATWIQIWERAFFHVICGPGRYFWGGNIGTINGPGNEPSYGKWEQGYFCAPYIHPPLLYCSPACRVPPGASGCSLWVAVRCNTRVHVLRAHQEDEGEWMRFVGMEPNGRSGARGGRFNIG